jgi:hypothetical protein
LRRRGVRLPAILLILTATFTQAADLDQLQPYVAARASSHATDGSNNDRTVMEPKSSRVAADLRGAGRIVHMWFTIGTAEANYLETTRLKIFWDGGKTAAVDVPFGLFHALGHSAIRPVRSAFISVESRPELNHNLQNPNVGGFNSYFAMPFGTGARVVIENTSDQVIRVYHQIDYQIWKAAPSVLRFHAGFRETNAEPFPGAKACGIEEKNPQGLGNHIICDVKGTGHLVGVVLSVDASGAGWWEGDEMIWVDGRAAPALHGTGTEDYFGGAWGFREEYSAPYHGVSVLLKVPGRQDWQAGKYTVYRFHEKDPVAFTSSLKMSIERGHNNCRRDSQYRSVAYWYQR